MRGEGPRSELIVADYRIHRDRQFCRHPAQCYYRCKLPSTALPPLTDPIWAKARMLRFNRRLFLEI